MPVQERMEEKAHMSGTPLYKSEKFISSGESSAILVLKEVNDYHLWFKRCDAQGLYCKFHN